MRPGVAKWEPANAGRPLVAVDSLTRQGSIYEFEGRGREECPAGGKATRESAAVPDRNSAEFGRRRIATQRRRIARGSNASKNGDRVPTVRLAPILMVLQSRIPSTRFTRLSKSRPTMPLGKSFNGFSAVVKNHQRLANSSHRHRLRQESLFKIVVPADKPTRQPDQQTQNTPVGPPGRQSRHVTCNRVRGEVDDLAQHLHSWLAWQRGPCCDVGPMLSGIHADDRETSNRD
jgi:hypothetical protein